MKASRRILVVFALIAMTVAANVARGQMIAPDLQPGLLPYQSYHGGDIDKVNLSNGIVNVQIPLIGYPQRGGKLKLDFALAFHSKPLIYQKFCTPQIPHGPPPTCQWAWLQFVYGQSSFEYPTSGWYVADTQAISFANYDEKVPIGNGPSTTDYNWIQVQTGDGSIHPSGQITGSTGQTTLDGTNYASIGYDPTAGCASTCYTLDADGIMYLNTNWTSVIREDSDGNEISLASGNYTDTVGRTVPALPTPTTSFTSQQAAVCKGSLPVYELAVWQVPGVNGSSQTYTFCYAQVPFLVPNPNQSPYTQSGNLVQLQSVALPSGLSWIFGYDATNGTSTAYGDLTSITFPTGGTIAYTYQSIQSTASPADHTTRWVASRTENANDGQGAHEWQYAFILGTAAGGLGQSSGTTTVTDPYGNQAVHTFSNAMFNGYETLAQYYSGSASSGSLLRSTATTYNYLSPSGYFYPAQVMNAFPASQTTTLDNGLSSVKSWSYCCSITLNQEGSSGTYGLQSDEKDYDFASSGTGTLLKEQQTAYEFQTNPSYLTANLLNLKASDEVLNGSGTAMALTSYTYDESSYSGKSSGITTQHTSAPFSTRGEVTTATNWLNGGTSPKSHTGWYDTGEVYQSIDPLGRTTTYGYAGTYAGSLPTTITNALNQITTYTYDVNTGQKTSVTDPNSQVTTYSYNDPLSRLTDVLYPDVDPATGVHGESKYQYNDLSSPVNFVFTKVLSPSQSLEEQVNVDGFGRKWSTDLTTDPSGPDYVMTTYDGLGRVQSVSNPYRTTSDSTYGITSYLYDALGRKIKQCQPDNSSTPSTTCVPANSYETWNYTGNFTTLFNENGNGWQWFYDGLGRLTKVLEPNGASPAATLETDYSYDAANNLLTAVQRGANGETARTRTFTYDSLGRLITATNPETGTICYGTWNGSACQNGYDANGNLIAKTDARGVTTTYAYDTLNRRTNEVHSDGTPAFGWSYDQSSVYIGFGTFNITNGIGRLTSEQSGSGSSSWCAAHSYDSMGRPAQNEFVWGCTSVATTPIQTIQYDLAGNPTFYDNGNWQAFRYAYNNVGQATSVTVGISGQSNPEATLVSGILYDPTGGATTSNLGNGSQEQISRDNRGRVVADQLEPSTSGGTAIFGWNAGYDHVGNLTSLSDSYVMGNWNYTYDTLNRLSTAVASLPYSGWGGTVGAQTASTGCQYSYDSFGNRKGEAPYGSGKQCFSGTFNYSNNRVSTPGYTYDAAGDLTYDGTYTYGYDAEGRLTSVTGSGTSATYLYNPEGQRITANVNGVTTTFVHDLEGRLAFRNLGSALPQEIYLNGRHFGSLLMNADHSLNKVTYSMVDPVGTEREQFDGNKNPIATFTSDPFGANLITTAGSNADSVHFTGKERDTESGNDYFGARYYASSMGRFMSPDDDGGHLEDPQTLNKYAYVGNNPLSRIDPDGHDFWQSCDKASSTCQNQQIGTNKDGSAINHLVQGTTDSNGKFTAGVVTSASLSDPNSGNSATVNGTGVQITSSTGTAQGIFINGTPGADIKGDSSAAGWNQFSFRIDSNDAQHGVLTAGTATYLGQGGYQGMLDTIKGMSVNGHGPFTYPEEMFGNPKHPEAAYNFRFSTGAHPDLFNYGPSPHFPVPHSGTSSNFHVDSKTGPMHAPCALMGVGCY